MGLGWSDQLAERTDSDSSQAFGAIAQAGNGHSLVLMV